MILRKPCTAIATNSSFSLIHKFQYFSACETGTAIFQAHPSNNFTIVIKAVIISSSSKFAAYGFSNLLLSGFDINRNHYVASHLMAGRRQCMFRRKLKIVALSQYGY